MRFMMIMIPEAYNSASPGTMPDAKAVQAMMVYNNDLQKAGILRALDGLHPPSMGARLKFSSGKPEVIKGPFEGVTEVIGGYWVIEVGSLQEAIEWAKRCPAGPTDIIEIRQVMGNDDFSLEIREVLDQYPDL